MVQTTGWKPAWLRGVEPVPGKTKTEKRERFGHREGRNQRRNRCREFRTDRQVAPALGLCGYKKARNKSGLWCSGGDREDRTPDLLIANQTLSQLSYAPIERCILQITVFLVKKEPRRQLVPTQAFQNAWLGGLSPTSAGFFLGIFSQAASAGKNRIAPSTFTRNMKASSKPISA